MEAKPVINIVATTCPPQLEEKFNKWYNEVHVPMLMKYKGITGVTRYKIIKPAPEHPQYIAVYRYQSQKDCAALGTSPEFAAAIEEMKGTWKGGGFEIKWSVQYEQLKSWEG